MRGLRDGQQPEMAFGRCRRLAALLALLGLLVCGIGACGSGAEVAWADVPPSPASEGYSGSIERVLEDRLSSRLAEQNLELVDSRVEYLPPGVGWSAHVVWRSEHAAGLDEVSDRLDLPEPDAPALEAKYSDGTSTLFVIGRADDVGERLVVLTALARNG